jgi:hypothetical protein
MSAGATARRDGLRENVHVAEQLERVADLLDEQGANRFRVDSYRRAAAVLRSIGTDVRLLVAREGRAGLAALPDIGRSLSSAILELVETGRLRLLDRLLGAASPEDLFASLPGVGPELARRIHEHLGAETLEDLEVAAWDGRLAQVAGFGPRRVETLRALLEARLRSRRRLAGPGDPHVIRTCSRPEPSVADLLSVDAEYRAKAAARKLPVITPRRFNPKGTAWLPVLHTARGPLSFHAFFSNTPLAHRLGRTRDWVVIYYDEDGAEGQATVVTERRGDLQGLRVVRGREEACRGHYLRSA